MPQPNHKRNREVHRVAPWAIRTLAGLSLFAMFVAAASWFLPMEVAHSWGLEGVGNDDFAQFEAIGRAEALCWVVRFASTLAALGCFIGWWNADRFVPLMSDAVDGALAATNVDRADSAVAGRTGIVTWFFRAGIVGWMVLFAVHLGASVNKSFNEWPYYKLKFGALVLPNVSDTNREVIRFLWRTIPADSRIFVVSDQKLFFLSYYVLPRRLYHKMHPDSEHVIPKEDLQRKLAAYQLADIDSATLRRIDPDYILEYFEFPDSVDRTRLEEDHAWIDYLRERHQDPTYLPNAYVRLHKVQAKGTAPPVRARVGCVHDVAGPGWVIDALWLAFGLMGQWLLGVAVASRLLAWRPMSRSALQAAPAREDSTTGWTELLGLGLVLGQGLTAWALFVWSFLGGPLDLLPSLILAGIGWVWGGVVVGTRRRQRSDSLRKPATIRVPADEVASRGEWAWGRSCLALAVLLFGILFVQTLLTPHRYWDERAIFAIKGIILFEDASIRSHDLQDPDFVQYHPRYPMLLPLAEHHVYSLLGRVDDRLSKVIFPLMWLGLVLSVAGVCSRYVGLGRGWLLGLMVATIPVLVPFEYGFLCGQADAPMACFHGVAILSLWDARRRVLLEGAGWVGATLVAGLCCGFAAFTKDEGIAFLIVDIVALALLTAVTARRDRSLIMLALFAGISGAIVLPWLIHRQTLPFTTEMNYFGRASFGLFIHRLDVLAWEVPHLLSRMFFEALQWGLHWWLMALALLVPSRWRSGREPGALAWRDGSQGLLILDVVGAVSFLLLAGMFAPAELEEHIGGSSHRFLMQLAPVAIIFVAGQWSFPGSSNEGPGRGSNLIS